MRLVAPFLLWQCLAIIFMAACGSTVSTGPKGPGESCTASSDCADGLYCELGALYPSCDDPTEATCEPRPESCEAMTAPVCGCDGAVYGSWCAARLAGTNPYGRDCEPGPGLASCGSTFCDPSISFCGTLGDGGQSCQPLPTSCQGSLDCGCFESDWRCDGFFDIPMCSDGDAILFVHCGFR
jgi:hypothetical protein